MLEERLVGTQENRDVEVGRNRHGRQPGHRPRDGHPPRAGLSALALIARGLASLEQTAKAVTAAGAEALIIDADLSQPAAPLAVVDRVMAAFGRIDALLNIAGAVPQIDLFEMTDAQWDNGLALKLHGARRLTIAAWPALKAARGRSGADVGQFGFVPKGTLCGGRRSMPRLLPWPGLLRPRHHRRRTGQQRIARTRDDRAPALLSRALGAAAQRDGQEATANFPKETGIARAASRRRSPS